MTLRFVVLVDGDLKALLNDRVGELAEAARAAVRATAEALQAELRQQVLGAGLGAGLANAWRVEVYPKSARASLRPAGLVTSKAPRLHEAFDLGEPVRAHGSGWLALPLPPARAAGLDRSPGRGDAARGGRFAATPAKWSNVAEAERRFGRLRFVLVRGGAAALLIPPPSRARPRPEPLFLLLRQVSGSKRLDIDAAARRAEARLALNLSTVLGGRP